MQSEVKALEDVFMKWDRTRKTVLMCKAGERLKILHDGGTALVVQREDGERFSISTDKTDYKNVQ